MHIFKFYFFLFFFDAVYICISLNYVVIKQVLSSKQCLSFFLKTNEMTVRPAKTKISLGIRTV